MWSVCLRSIVLILIFISEVIDARRRHTSNHHHRNNARTSCHSNGGSCEPMFGCILKQGYMSGSCHGFLQVCCITPTFVSRRFKENSIFDSGPPSQIDYGPVVNDPVCGRPPNSNRRVLDGEPAGFGSFPWQALIRV